MVVGRRTGWIHPKGGRRGRRRGPMSPFLSLPPPPRLRPLLILTHLLLPYRPLSPMPDNPIPPSQPSSTPPLSHISSILDCDFLRSKAAAVDGGGGVGVDRRWEDHPLFGQGEEDSIPRCARTLSRATGGVEFGVASFVEVAGVGGCVDGSTVESPPPAAPSPSSRPPPP